MTAIDCDDALLLLAASDERALAADERRRLDEHGAACERCRELVGGDVTAPSDLDDGAGATGLPPMPPADDRNANGIPDRFESDDDEDLRALPVIDPGLYAWAETIGRGGMGRVMAARDRRLGRRVAIKELISRGLEQRFEAEARITARLEHPAIVHVHEAGRWPSGELFYAMKLVEGTPLSGLIRDRDTLDARIGLLTNVMAVVDAIAYAHSQGVIHRDLKPSNIVVGPFGETVVIDWGLAKDLADTGEATNGAYRDAADGATAAGLGTPQYMPPEQARGEAPDRRVDVYALGATLYHVLAGAPPYGPKLRTAQVLVRLQQEGPPPIEQVQPKVPRDLAAIVNKAMARDPADRYADAAALAADLRRFEAGQLVSATTYSMWSLARRWIGRHVALVAVAAVTLALAATAGTLGLRRVVAERAAARAARDVAQRERASWLTELGRAELLAGDAQRATPYLVEASAQAQGDVLRLMLGVAMRSFDAQRVVFAGDQPIDAVALSPDGTRIAIATPGRLEISSVGARAEPSVGIALSEPAILDLAWSDDGRSVIAGSDDSTAQRWAIDGTLQATFVDHGHAVRRVMPLVGGDVLSLGDDGTLRRWRDGNDGRVLYRTEHWMRIVTIDRTGRYALTIPEEVDPEVDVIGAIGVLVDLATGDAELPIHEVPDLALVSGDRLFYSVGSDVHILPFDGRLEQRREVHARAAVVRLAFSPDETLLVAGDAEGNLTLWDVASGAPVAEVSAHRGPISGLSFDGAGAQLVSAGDDGYVRRWDVAALRAHTAFIGAPRAWKMIATSHDAAAVAVPGGVAVIRGGVRHDLPIADTAQAIALTPSAEHLLVKDDGLEVWDVARATRLARLDGGIHEMVPRGPDTVITFEEDRVVLRDVATLAEREVLVRYPPGPRERGPVAVAGDIVITGRRDGWLSFSAFGSPTARELPVHPAPVELVAVSADGRRLATADDGEVVDVRDLTRGELGQSELMVRIPQHDAVTALAFDATGALLAIGDERGVVTLWDVDRGTPLVHLPRRSSEIMGLRFTGDGHTLIIAEATGPAQLWRVPREARDAVALNASFAPKATWLIVGGRMSSYPAMRGHRRSFQGAGGDTTYDMSGITITPASDRADVTSEPAAEDLAPAERRSSSLSRGFQRHAGAIRACVERVVQVEPEIHGTVTIGLYLDRDGAILDSDLRPYPGDRGLAAISQCLRTQLRGWTFPVKRQPRNSTVLYPVRIEPVTR